MVSGEDRGMTRIYLTTATGGLSTDVAPVGGGVAVLEALLPALAARPDFEVTVLRPGSRADECEIDGVRWVDLPVPVLQDAAPDAFLHFGERRYARFALQWESALRRFFEAVDPGGAVVVANDVSEGPPFAWLHERGFRQVVLYHVVVADFFARQYLSGPFGVRLSAARAAQMWRAAERLGVGRLAPDIARLVWAKEGESARYAEALVAPSAPLAEALAVCYPGRGVESRAHVVPWGVIGEADPSLRALRRETLADYEIAEDRFVLLTLSRLSPEKRVEKLLGALRWIEKERPQLADRLALVVAGGPAYMGGDRYYAKLEQTAAELRRVEVRFVGYVGGESKWRLFAAADLFCSPSHYEAYGLTIAQALASGTPVLATAHQGARVIVEPEFGWIVGDGAQEIGAGVEQAVEMELGSMRESAAAWGQVHGFSDAAAALVSIIDGVSR